MRILVALIAVLMVSGAVADYRTERQVGWEDRKDICTDDDKNDVPGKKARPTYTCKDLKTGKKEKVQCKNPPKQKLPPKLSMAQLAEVCGLLDENGFPYRRAGD